MSTADTATMSSAKDNEGAVASGKNASIGQRDEHNVRPSSNAETGSQRTLPTSADQYKQAQEKETLSGKFANPGPLGLSAFALTTFVLSLINCQARGVTTPNIVLALAFGYGGLVQFCAGMWEMAVGNTFGATALSSYGGFWISYAILLTPSFGALSAYANPADAASAIGFFLLGWFIFTFLMLLCTLRSSAMFFATFFCLDLTFLMLFCAEFSRADGKVDAALRLQHAGGVLGLVTAFLGWYNALAGMADKSNSFFLLPVFDLPWSVKGRSRRAKTARESV